MTGEDAAPTRESVVSLREVTKESLGRVLRLKVSPEQDRFVASNAISIAQAYFDREIAWFRAIYADETPVGFLMLEDRPELPKYFLWRFMIDARFQGLGFGARAIALLLDHVRTRPGATELGVSVVPGDGGPGRFYEKQGFRYTGEVDEGELVLRQPLQRPRSPSDTREYHGPRRSRSAHPRDRPRDGLRGGAEDAPRGVPREEEEGPRPG